MKKENEQQKFFRDYLEKQEAEQQRIFRDYIGWRIYCRKRPYRQSDRDELVRTFKRRFKAWNCEEEDSELTLSDPEYPSFLITIRFGNFETCSQQKFSVEIESQSFGFRRRHTKTHAEVLKRILQILPRWKKEAYREEQQGLVLIDVKRMKYYGGVLWGRRLSYFLGLKSSVYNLQ